jgi:hypothetical protein
MTAPLRAGKEAAGRPLWMFLTAAQQRDYTGARALLDGFPRA